MFWFSLKFIFETFLILRRIQQDIVINAKTSSRKVPVTFVRYYWNLNFLNRFSKKVSNIIFNQNQSSGSRVPTDKHTHRQMDRYDKANSHFLQFCEHTQKLVNQCIIYQLQMLLISQPQIWVVYICYLNMLRHVNSYLQPRGTNSGASYTSSVNKQGGLFLLPFTQSMNHPDCSLIIVNTIPKHKSIPCSSTTCNKEKYPCQKGLKGAAAAGANNHITNTAEFTTHLIITPLQ